MVDQTPCTKCDHDGVDVVVAYHSTLRVEDRGPLSMTRDQLDDGSITTDDEFEAILAEAVEKAIKADVDVRGAWEFQTRGSTYDWEVQITELARYDGHEEG